MTQPLDKMRAEFEEKMLQQRSHSDFSRDDGGYFSPWMQAAWTGWRLACAQQSAKSQQDALAPLTDEQIKSASLKAGMQEHYMGFHSGFIKFARAIEAEHGITAIATQGASNV